MTLLKATAIVLVCLAVSGCGRKGPLEPPPGSAPSSFAPAGPSTD